MLGTKASGEAIQVIFMKGERLVAFERKELDSVTTWLMTKVIANYLCSQSGAITYEELHLRLELSGEFSNVFQL